MRKHRAFGLFGGALLGAAVLLAGCGGGNAANQPSSSAGNATQSAGGGPVTLNVYMDRDPSGTLEKVVQEFNQKYQGQIQVKMQQAPPSTDDYHSMAVRQLQAKSPEVDVYAMDVIWVPEFAAAGWVKDLTDKLAPIKGDYLEGPMQAVTYQGKMYAAPYRTDTGVLYYRSDLVSTPPKTWADLEADAKAGMAKGVDNGFVWQGKQYEGLICDFLEFVWSNGGDVLDANGKVVINQPQAVQALTEMKKLLDSGISPKGVLSYQEDDAQNVFHQGNAVFMRNWPYAWALNQASDSPVKGKIGVAPLPTGPSGTTPYSCLGGWNLAINTYSKHPDQAWTFIQYMMSPQVQKEIAIGASYEGTYKAIYQDPEVIKANPFFKDLYNVLVNTKPRPVTPYYPQISQSLQNHVSAALAGSETPQQALDAAAKEIQTAINQ